MDVPGRGHRRVDADPRRRRSPRRRGAGDSWPPRTRARGAPPHVGRTRGSAHRRDRPPEDTYVKLVPDTAVTPGERPGLIARWGAVAVLVFGTNAFFAIRSPAQAAGQPD